MTRIEDYERRARERASHVAHVHLPQAEDEGRKLGRAIAGEVKALGAGGSEQLAPEIDAMFARLRDESLAKLHERPHVVTVAFYEAARDAFLEEIKHRPAT